MKLAVIATHPVQYFAPVFRELASVEKLDLKVFFGCNHGSLPVVDPDFGVAFQWDSQPTAGYDHEFLSTASLASLEGGSGMKLASQAVKAINHYNPDAVLIFSYSPAFITASTILARLAGHRLMLRAETTDTALKRSYLKDKVRELALKLYYRQFKHFFPIGTNSINHYLRMGVDKELLTTVNYAIDVDFFQTQVESWLPQRDVLRQELNIAPDDHVFIYCGKMFPPKHPILIPAALAKLSQEQKRKIWFVAVGEGELRREFEDRMKAELGERSIFVGFKNQSELGMYYAMSDTLILASQSGETWGLVVNEALQFGLTAIVSSIVGSGCDILGDNRGWIFTSGDADDLAQKIVQSIDCKLSRNKSVNNFRELPHPQHLGQAIYDFLC